MMRLDQRGTAAWEFCLVAVPLFTLMFAIFDLGIYAFNMQSLRMLANAGARAVMISCYTDAAIKKELPTNCTAGSLPSAGDGRALTLTLGASALTVAASQKDFKMLMPIWGTTATALGLDIPGFNKPASASTSIPF
jgi:Flp pilus assembly protein TadG